MSNGNTCNFCKAGDILKSNLVADCMFYSLLVLLFCFPKLRERRKINLPFQTCAAFPAQLLQSLLGCPWGTRVGSGEKPNTPIWTQIRASQPIHSPAADPEKTYQLSQMQIFIWNKGSTPGPRSSSSSRRRGDQVPLSAWSTGGSQHSSTVLYPGTLHFCLA